MPSSKEVRARQNRQKERVAAQLAERKRAQKRRRAVGAVAAVIILVILVAVGFATGLNNGGNDKVAATPTTPFVSSTFATTTTLPSVKGKPCVGLKDPMPAGAPAMLLTPGPPPTKLTTQDLKIGTGPKVEKNQKVTINYVGVSCTTGKIFDSSYKHQQTLDADLSNAQTSNLIVGMKQGIPGMRIGGVRLVTIPSDLAYGAAGNPGAGIAPDQPLFFLVEAMKFA